MPYRKTDSQIGGVVITFVDLTQRKLAEAVKRETDARHFHELHESAERLQAILNTAADAIVTVDVHGTIDSVNLATETLFGYERTELIGKNIALLMPKSFSKQRAGEVSEPIEIELARLVSNRREVSAQRKDGSSFPVDLALSRVDHLGLYTGILRDITVRKQLQTHVLEIAANEQARIGQELHDGTQQELTGLSLFAGAIGEFLDKAKSTQLESDVDWTLEDSDFRRIKEGVAKLTQGLIEANLHVQKLSHGIMPVQIDAEGLKSALAELADLTNENQKIHCRFDFTGSGAITDNSIATQLYRIAQESLNNAIKHSKANDIRISLAQFPNQIVLEVRDNGIGFDVSKVTSSTVARSGLGLGIMKYRASVLGGDLQINRNVEHGTTVRCTIPTTGEMS